MSKPELSLEQAKKAFEEMQNHFAQHQQTQHAIEALMVYFMLTHGKDVGNMRKEFVLTLAEMEKLDPKHTHGIGIYFEPNPATRSTDLRCVCAPKESLLEEAHLAYGDVKGSA